MAIILQKGRKVEAKVERNHNKQLAKVSKKVYKVIKLPRLP